MKKTISLTPEQNCEIQAKQLDVLIKFHSICKEHGLRYYLMYGTLLGAVRHKGFIPWDDDADLIMPRKDYDTFKKHGSDWLGKEYFLQNQDTDPKTYTCVSKIRINNTLFRRVLDGHLNTHPGIFIDVIPLDHVSRNKLVRNLQNLYRKVLFTISLSKLGCRLTKNNTFAFAAKLLAPFCPTQALRNGIQQSMAKYEDRPTGLVAFALPYYPIETEIFEEETFGTPQEVDFEGHHLMVPADPHKILSQIYGDYMTPPPEENRKTTHTILEYCIDTTKSRACNT